MKTKYLSDLSGVQIGSPTHVAGVLYSALGSSPVPYLSLSESEFKACMQDFLKGDLAAVCLDCLEGVDHPSDRGVYAAFVLLVSFSPLPAMVSDADRVYFLGNVFSFGALTIDRYFIASGLPVLSVVQGFVSACFGCDPKSDCAQSQIAYQDQVAFVEGHALPFAFLVNRP